MLERQRILYSTHGSPWHPHHQTTWSHTAVGTWLFLLMFQKVGIHLLLVFLYWGH